MSGDLRTSTTNTEGHAAGGETASSRKTSQGTKPATRRLSQPPRKAAPRTAAPRTAASRTATGKTSAISLAQELEEQLKYRDTVAWSVGVLEQSVAELELQLDSLQRGSTDEADTEFKLRYEAQGDLNKKLQEQTEWYSQELAKTKERFRQAQQRASYNLTTLCQEYSYDADLDHYSEAELSVMVRQLERERNISYSEFRNKTWLLDSRSKEYHQLKDLCDAYSGDLSFVNRSLEEMWRKRSTSSSTSAPIMWNGEPGFLPAHRVINPRHGPVRKTAGVRSLPRLDPEALGALPSYESIRKADQRAQRTRSLDERGRRKRLAAEARLRHKSAQPTTASEPLDAPSTEELLLVAPPQELSSSGVEQTEDV
ncbi:coiled-coil domain-containing protein 169-like [Hyalella azteca]|uniref:Coiled-coil domain-containing protein 169-like n=1 Tax=Hyalella azteca TaxID=294128 RepID=A0A8B7PP54_HYAAZ|nr:coiled-coil domain-containing protein 169-like [Hyalella azteca]